MILGYWKRVLGRKSDSLKIVSSIILLSLSLISIADILFQQPTGVILGTEAQSYSSEINLNLSDLYYTKYVNLGIKASRALALDNNVLVVAGSLNKTGIIRIFSFSEDLKKAVYNDYVVHGYVTSLSAPNTKTPNLIVAGTDTGEIAAIDLLQNRITYIQASRESIREIYVGNIGIDSYIVAFDGSFLYSYKYSQGGWLEIGPVDSTMLMGYTSASIFYVSPLIRVMGDHIEYDLTKLFVIYSPPTVKLVLNVTDPSGFPINNALITLTYLRNRDIYYSTVSVNGSAVLNIPILDANVSNYELRVTHPSYETYTEIISLPKPRRPDETISILIVMRPGQGISELLRPVPERSFVAIYELDLSSIPYKATLKSSLIIPAKISKAFFYEPYNNIYSDRYKYLAVYATKNGFYITYYDSQYNIVKVGGENYINYYLSIKDPEKINARISANGEYISLSVDSKIYLAKYMPELSKHVLTSSYTFDSDLASIDLSNNQILVATSTSGEINIFKVENSVLKPCLRSNYYTEYLGRTELYAHIFRDGSNAFIVGRDNGLVMDTNVIISKCPMEKILIKLSPEIESVQKKYLGILGTLYVYEGTDLVATAYIKDSEAIVYLPYSTYRIVVESVQTGKVEYSNIVVRNTNIVKLKVSVIPVDLFVRIRSERSSIPLSPVEAPLGIEISVKNIDTNYSLNLTLTSNPLPIYISKGVYEIDVLYNGILLASGKTNISDPGIIFADLVAKTARLTYTVINDLDNTIIDLNVLNITITSEGPIWRGISVPIKTAHLELPLGFYRISLSSVFYMDTMAYVELFRDTNKTFRVVPIPFDLRLHLIDDLGRNVGRASIYMKNIITGAEYSAVSDERGVATIKDVMYGIYVVNISPENQIYYQPTTIRMLVDKTDMILRINTSRKTLILNLIDPISGAPSVPIKISIFVDRNLVDIIETSDISINLSLPVGVLEVYVEGALDQVKVYYPYNVTRLFLNDTELTIYLSRVPMRIRFFVEDRLGTPIDANIRIISVENSSLSYDLSSAGGVAEIVVPYGRYLADISARYRESVRISIQPPQNVSEVISLKISLPNILTPLNLTLRDQLGLPLRGQFIAEIYVGGKLYIRQIINKTIVTLYVPTGYNVSLKMSPLEEISYLYQPLSKDLGFVDKSLNATLVIMRRIYRVSLTITDDLGKPLVAKIILTSTENSAYMYDAITDTDGIGILSVPAGDYTVEVLSSGYEKYSDTLSVKADINKRIALSPQIQTLLLRFTYVYIGIAIILIVLGFAMWLRRIVLKRLEEEII
ncbi:MAG: carboxypeptidase-like regulatory domain-containing protein [Sulfolobales archaeon]